jgi:hypothetical protein
MSSTTKGNKTKNKVNKPDDESKREITETDTEDRTESMDKATSGGVGDMIDQVDMIDQQQQKLDITTGTGVVTDANTIKEDELEDEREEDITPLDIPTYDLTMMIARNEKRLVTSTYTKVFSNTIIDSINVKYREINYDLPPNVKELARPSFKYKKVKTRDDIMEIMTSESVALNLNNNGLLERLKDHLFFEERKMYKQPLKRDMSAPWSMEIIATQLYDDWRGPFGFDMRKGAKKDLDVDAIGIALLFSIFRSVTNASRKIKAFTDYKANCSDDERERVISKKSNSKEMWEALFKEILWYNHADLTSYSRALRADLTTLIQDQSMLLLLNVDLADLAHQDEYRHDQAQPFVFKWDLINESRVDDTDGETSLTTIFKTEIDIYCYLQLRDTFRLVNEVTLPALHLEIMHVPSDTSIWPEPEIKSYTVSGVVIKGYVHYLPPNDGTAPPPTTYEETTCTKTYFYKYCYETCGGIGAKNSFKRNYKSLAHGVLLFFSEKYDQLDWYAPLAIIRSNLIPSTDEMCVKFMLQQTDSMKRLSKLIEKDPRLYILPRTWYKREPGTMTPCAITMSVEDILSDCEIVRQQVIEMEDFIEENEAFGETDHILQREASAGRLNVHPSEKDLVRIMRMTRKAVNKAKKLESETKVSFLKRIDEESSVPMESSQSTYFPDDITNSDDQGTHDTSLSQQKSDTSSYHPKDDISITPIAMTLRTRSSLVNYDENISPLTEPKRVTTTTVPIREQMLDEPVILNTSPVGLARAERLNDERDEQLELTEGRLLNNLNIWDVTSLPARQKVQEALKRDVINNTLDNDNVNSNTTANKDTEFMVDPLTAYNLRLERISKTWRAESDEAARNGTLLKLDTSEAFMNNQEYHQLMFARNKEDESLSRLGMSRLARNGPALNEMTAAECESFKSAVEEELSMVTARALKPMGDGDDDGSSSSSSSEDDDSDSDRGNKKKKSSKKKSSKKKSSNSSRRSSDDDSRSISSFTETKSVSAKSTTSSKSRNVKAVLTTITERLVAKAENYETTAGIDGLIKNMKSILDTLKIDDGSGEKTDIDKHKRIQTLARKIGTFIDNSLSVFDVISVGIGKDIVNSNYDIQEALSTEHEKVETATETLNRLRLSHQNKPTTSRDYNRSQLELQFKPAYWDRKHQIER